MAIWKILSSVLLTITLIMSSSSALASRSTLANGYLTVPRIDVDGYGALELSFRLEFNEQYLLVLEQAIETSMSISNSGVFDPVEFSIELDEVELPSGKLYSAQLQLISDEGQFIFSIADTIDLNPDHQAGGTAPAVSNLLGPEGKMIRQPSESE